jgi:hypothetical protein
VTGYNDKDVEILSFATRGIEVDDIIKKTTLHLFFRYRRNIFPAKKSVSLA